MNKRLFRVFMSALLATSCAPALSVAAPASAPTPVPVTRPDFSSMKYFLGTWTCHQMLRGKNRPDTSTTAIGLDGAYMVSHDTAPAFDKYRTQAIYTDGYTTYNAAKHNWVTFTMDSFGGYSVSTSPGWNGNTLTTTLVMTQDGTTGSDTLTKISSTQSRDVATAKSPGGMVTHSTVICTKA